MTVGFKCLYIMLAYLVFCFSRSLALARQECVAFIWFNIVMTISTRVPMICTVRAGEGVSVEAQSLADEYRASALELVDLLNLEPSSHTKLKV